LSSIIFKYFMVINFLKINYKKSDKSDIIIKIICYNVVTSTGVILL